MPIFDLFCIDDKCKYEEDDVILKIDEEPHKCPDCGGNLERKCNCSHFELRYNNRTDKCDWDGNSSQYFNEINKQRAEGKDVVDPNADKWV